MTASLRLFPPLRKEGSNYGNVPSSSRASCDGYRAMPIKCSAQHLAEGLYASSSLEAPPERELCEGRVHPRVRGGEEPVLGERMMRRG